MSTIFSEATPLSLTGLPRSGRRSHDANSWSRVVAGWRLIRLRARRGAQRRALAYLMTQTHLLADTGLIERLSRETRKPFWQR